MVQRQIAAAAADSAAAASVGMIHHRLCNNKRQRCRIVGTENLGTLSSLLPAANTVVRAIVGGVPTVVVEAVGRTVADAAINAVTVAETVAVVGASNNTVQGVVCQADYGGCVVDYRINVVFVVVVSLVCFDIVACIVLILTVAVGTRATSTFTMFQMWRHTGRMESMPTTTGSLLLFMK